MKSSDSTPVTRVFTFGYGQTCPLTGIDLVGRYATVTAASDGACREAMFASVFKNRWAFEYSSAEAAAAPGEQLVEHARIDEHGNLALVPAPSRIEVIVPVPAAPEIPAHLKQLVDQLTESEGEVLGEIGLSLADAQAFERIWEQLVLPELITEVTAVIEQQLARSQRIVRAAASWAAAWDDVMTQGEDAGPAFTEAADALLAAVRPDQEA